MQASTNIYRLLAATALHQGDRDYQQDQVTIFQHPQHAECLLGVLSDGMGGKSGGRTASEQVILTAGQIFEHFHPMFDDGKAMLSRLVSEAHMLIRLTAITSEQEPHATVAAFLVMPDRRCLWVHCGDSRLYHFRGANLCQRTRDHSYVQRLMDEGHITEEDAGFHPHANILLDCLGAVVDPTPTFGQIDKLEAGDTVLACSDGVWPYFSSREIGIVLHTLPVNEAAQLLIETARQRAKGMGDNLSVALLGIQPTHLS